MEDEVASRKGRASPPAAAERLEGEARDKTKRPSRATGVAGDDIGAAELGRRVADNLRGKRKARGMSLDDLAAASGVSRAALSQIETYKSIPTLGLLWKIAVGLGVPFNELIGQSSGSVSVLRRSDMSVLRSVDGKMESRPLAPIGTTPLVELYELRLAARSQHASEAHARGTSEVVIVLTGALRLHVDGEVHELAAGDSICFPADRPHAYENPTGGEARYHNLIAYER
jgi:XRE family transcriptional regulator, regulator of sulfur utilization